MTKNTVGNRGVLGDTADFLVAKTPEADGAEVNSLISGTFPCQRVGKCNLHQLDNSPEKLHLILSSSFLGHLWASRLELMVEFVVEGKIMAAVKFLVACLLISWEIIGRTAEPRVRVLALGQAWSRTSRSLSPTPVQAADFGSRCCKLPNSIRGRVCHPPPRFLILQAKWQRRLLSY